MKIIEFEEFFSWYSTSCVAGIEPTPLKLPVQTPLKSGRVISVSCEMRAVACVAFLI